MIAKMKSAWTRYQRTRRTARELNSLTDKELSDIGIARCDIWTVARTV